MASPDTRTLRRWLPNVRRMLYLVGLSNVADALGVEATPPDVQVFVEDTVAHFDALSHEFVTLSTADKQGAETTFAQALECTTNQEIWRGAFDGPEGVTARLKTPEVNRLQRDLGSDGASQYLDLLLREVSAKLCTWLEERPLHDPVGLVIAATRSLTEQNDETRQLLHDIKSLLRSPETESDREASRRRLHARSQTARSMLEPDVLPARPRLNDLDPHSIGSSDSPYPVVLTGDGGQGKSVFLGQLFDISSAVRPVILILASQIPAGAELGTPHALDEALGKAAYGLTQAPSLTEILRASYSSIRPVVLIDTIDLVLSDSTADAIEQLFDQLAAVCDLVITCRGREWDDFLPGLTGQWTDIRIPGLSPDQIAAWTSAYLSTANLTSELTSSFQTAVTSAANNSRQREVLQVPLRLAMACRLYAPTGELPHQLSVTQLYDAYWNSKVAQDRRGRRGELAAEQEAAAFQLAGDLWELSRVRFSDTVPASPFTIHACRALLSEGILKKDHARYSFFHQTFAEFAVARYLAAHGTASDWETLGKALNQGSAGHWGTATHLLVDSMNFSRFAEVAAHVPPDNALGVRLLLRGVFARSPDEAGVFFSNLAATHTHAVAGASDLLEAAPNSWISLVLETSIPWLSSPMVRSGPFVNAIAALLARCDQGAPAVLLEKALRSLLAEPGPELPFYARRLLHAALAPGSASLIPPVSALPLYADMPEPARAELLALQVATHDHTADADILETALSEPCPKGGADDGAALIVRCWDDETVRSRLGWTDWPALLRAKYPGRWDSAQLRAVVELARTDALSKREIVEVALSPGGVVPRDRIHNIIHFLAEDDPRQIADAALAVPAEPHREAAGTFAVLTRTVAARIDPDKRLTLIGRLRAWAAFDPRRVWPALVRSAVEHQEVLTEMVAAIGSEADLATRRSSFDALIKELGPEGRRLHRTRLASLVSSAEPPDRERRALLHGYLAFDDGAARQAVLRYLAAQPNAREPLAAGRALVEMLEARTSPLGQELSTWLMWILATRQDHVVRTVARTLGDRISLLTWNTEAVNNVVRRHKESLDRGEDAQVAAALKDLLSGLIHIEDPLLSELVTPAHVECVADQYMSAIQDIYDQPSRGIKRLPALYVHTNQMLTELAFESLPRETAEAYVVQLLTELDSAGIAGRSSRALASTLVGFTQRYPQRWGAVIETYWSQIPGANKMAVAECLERGSVPDARARASALARRADCPREVADALLKAFPD